MFTIFCVNREYCKAILNNPSPEFKIKYIYFIPYNICYLKKLLTRGKFGNSSNVVINEYNESGHRREISLPRELSEYILYTKTNYEKDLSNCTETTNEDNSNRYNKYFRMIVLYENGNIGEVEFKVYE